MPPIKSDIKRANTIPTSGATQSGTMEPEFPSCVAVVVVFMIHIRTGVCVEKAGTRFAGAKIA